MARNDGRRPRLSDTAEIVRQGINPPGAKIAPFGGSSCWERGADNAVGEPHAGKFRRETGPDGPRKERASDELD